MKIVGCGFRPKDVELVDFYLKLKLLDDPRALVMTEIDLCDVEPWEVPARLAKSVIPFDDREWFFFSPVDFKYSGSKRVNRRTKSGFWKPTGKERDVRSWDTTTVIGTKKTLVFCMGRASKGVKAEWVIHEYHALTFHENQKAFVLCRLIKKPGKKIEGGNDALICDGGESGGSVVSDCENQAIAEGVPSGGTYTGMATHQADKCISPMESSLVDIEQNEVSFPNYTSNNVYFKNEIKITQIPPETIQIPPETIQIPPETMQIPPETMQIPPETMQIPPETMQIPPETMQIPPETMHSSLISSLLNEAPSEATEAEAVSEYLITGTMQAMALLSETIQTPLPEVLPCLLSKAMLAPSKTSFLNSSTQSKSLKRAYCESPYIDAEVVPKLDASMGDMSIMYTKDLNSKEYYSSKRFKASYYVTHCDTRLHFSNQEDDKEKQESIFQDDFWREETSSCDSTTNKPLEINCNEISSFLAF